jgi:hypothetical protein
MAKDLYDILVLGSKAGSAQPRPSKAHLWLLGALPRVANGAHGQVARFLGL